MLARSLLAILLLGMAMRLPALAQGQPPAPDPQPSAPMSCLAELEQIRDKLRPLVQDIGERAGACGAREGYVKRLGELEGRLAEAQSALSRAGKEADAQREEASRLASLLTGFVARQAAQPDAGCDQLDAPRYAAGQVVLTGHVGNLTRWREKASNLSQDLGVAVTTDRLLEEACGVTLAPGWRIELVDNGYRSARFDDLQETLRDEVPQQGDCASLGRQLAERQDSDPTRRVSSFWVATPASAAEPPPAWKVCLVSARPNVDGRLVDYQPGRSYLVIAREQAR